MKDITCSELSFQHTRTDLSVELVKIVNVYSVVMTGLIRTEGARGQRLVYSQGQTGLQIDWYMAWGAD